MKSPELLRVDASEVGNLKIEILDRESRVAVQVEFNADGVHVTPSCAFTVEEGTGAVSIHLDTAPKAIEAVRLTPIDF